MGYRLRIGPAIDSKKFEIFGWITSEYMGTLIGKLMKS